jgi:carboxypeptidase family protein
VGRLFRVGLVVGAVWALLPAAALAQEGQIAGIVRDSSGGVVPGVTVEATSPALIEKVRSAITDTNGQYRLTNLPVGIYKVTFTLSGFTKQERDGIELTSGFTAPVNATMAVGNLTETVVVSGTSPVVDVQNARQAITFEGDTLKELPTARNINSLLELTPGIASNYRTGQSFGQPGVCVGGVGVFCNPSVNGFNQGDSGASFNTGGGDADGTNNLNQGRIMVDGQVVNGGTVVGIGGMTSGYTADIGGAQEVNIQLSGALGESETGGASINIVPRTGGNKFAGTWNTTYTTEGWFDRNTDAFRKGCNDTPPGICVGAVFQPVKYDYDVSGSFGGPIKRDRLWFYVNGRDQEIRKLPVGVDFWPNLNEGKWGYNYQPDRSKDRVEYQNKWKNISARFTYQATQKNKFNIYWDEQDFCQDPCDGVVSVFTSPESWWSVAIKPNRLQQVTWTNPLTNKILLEAGLSITSQFYDTTRHRQYTNPIEIPRVDEFGTTAGMDSVAPRVNQFAGAPGFNLTSGSLASAIGGGGAETRDMNNYRSRASMSYVTGSHHAKFGYDGGYYMQDQKNQMNGPRLFYRYQMPATNCANTAPLSSFPCGNTSLQYPEDPFNLALRPVPLNVQFYDGQATVGDRVWYGAAYAQDQWTFRRFTLSGAVRYDHAASRYLSTCIGGPNEPYMPTQTNGSKSYCTPDTDGVSFDDITPRWGATYDLFGNGKTSIKWNMGRYNNQAAISGIYSSANPARRTVNSLQRAWNDIDGDRRVDCDLMNFATNGECGAFSFGLNDTARYGKDPASLDAVGQPVGLDTVQCGRTESGIFRPVQSYCNAYGDSLVSGWGKRQYEWQLGIGIQHEILPRLSGEVTYNKRLYRNLQSTDQLGLGCDRFNGAVDHDACVDNLLNYSSPTYDFYTVKAPTDPRLPGGGGYTITGLNDQRINIPGTCLSGGVPTVCRAVTIDPNLNYSWQGVDTNFVWRGPKGIRINGGTSTGRTSRDRCAALVDAPNVRGRESNPYEAGCRAHTIWESRINGTAAYNIPVVDVLVSTVFQSLPGPQVAANFTYNKSDLVWNAPSAGRATEACSTAAAGVGCLGTARNLTTVTVPLLLTNEIIGERTSLFDLKIAKNIRFANKRATIGVDIYNLFNSDAINSYNTTFSGTFVNGVFVPAVDNPATPTVNEGNHWLEPTGLVSSRFARVSVQFNF